MDDKKLDQWILLLWNLYDPNFRGSTFYGQQAKIRFEGSPEFVEHPSGYVFDNRIHQNGSRIDSHTQELWTLSQRLHS